MRRGRLWRKQRGFGSSTRKITRTTSTSPGDGRMWNRARATPTREQKWLITCTKPNRGWEDWWGSATDTTTLSMQVCCRKQCSAHKVLEQITYFVTAVMNPHALFLLRAASRSPHTTHHSQNRPAPRGEAGSEARGPPSCWQQQAKHRLQQRRHLWAQHWCHQQHGDLRRARVRPVPPAQRPRLGLLRPALRPQPRAASGAWRILRFLLRPRGCQRAGVEPQGQHVLHLSLSRRGGPAPAPHQDGAAEPEPLQRALPQVPLALRLQLLQQPGLRHLGHVGRLGRSVFLQLPVWLFWHPELQLLQPLLRLPLQPLPVPLLPLLQAALQQPHPQQSVHGSCPQPHRLQLGPARLHHAVSALKRGTREKKKNGVSSLPETHSDRCTTNEGSWGAGGEVCCVCEAACDHLNVKHTKGKKKVPADFIQSYMMKKKKKKLQKKNTLVQTFYTKTNCVVGEPKLLHEEMSPTPTSCTSHRLLSSLRLHVRAHSR